ncbi:PAS domain S-box protein [Flavobacterium sp. ZT3R25]|uniref:PAS domain S-box protein n=1 Tax=Flavobacterium galactosi TaxID=3398735 RepID=UPI003A894F65
MKTKILIVEHDPSDIELIQHELKKGNVNYISEMVQTENEYEKALHNFKPDIILSNYTFPYFDGATAFKLKKKLAPKTPFIFVTESIGEEKAIKLIKKGVTDLVLKKNLSNLTTKVNRLLKESTLSTKTPTVVEKILDSSLNINYSITKETPKKKKLEKASKIEKEWFYDLFLQAPFSMGILKGPNHVYEMVNRFYLELIGKKDIIGKSVKEVRPEIVANGLIEILDQVYKTGIYFSANEVLIKLDKENNGEIVDMYANFLYQAHRNKEGNIDGVFFIAVDVSEQVISRKKIEANENRYEEILQNLPMATYSCDAEGHIIKYNKAATVLWGREPEIGKDMWCGSCTIYDMDGNPIPLDSCPMAVVLREGKVIVGEEIIIERPNGEKRNVASYSIPFIDVESQITGAINVLTDVTENKVAQQTLKESEKKYRQIVETAQKGIWLVDENYLTRFVNKKMGEILEYTREEMIGKDIYFFMDDRGNQIVERLLLRREEKYTRQSRFKYISKFGKEVWTHISTNPLFDEAGIYKESLAMVTDITESKKAELNLKQLNKELTYYKYALDESSIVAIIEHKGIIKHVNDNFCKISKYSRKELINQDYSIISSEYHSKEFFQSIWKTMANGKLWKGEIKNKAKDGTIYWVDTTITPFLNEEGKPYQFVVTQFDITAHKKAEQNLEQKNKELIKTNTELDRFVYSVSHDLRSPLTSILGLISFIEEESQEADTLEHIIMIRNSINRLDEFIKNILNYSRNNRMGLEIEKISLQKTTVDIVDSLRSMKEAKGIHFEIDIKEQQPFYSDKLRFNTILENLISNAIKYHQKDKSGRYIKITGQSDHEKLQFSIADNGIGIASAHQTKIFDMFFRLSGNKDGSGIGLYIVKDTVGILQGTIQIQSEEGVGTDFIITLKNLKK